MAMPKALARYWAKRRKKSSSSRRKRAKRNYYSAGMLANPRKRRTRRSRRRATVSHVINRRVTRRHSRRRSVRRYRSNPGAAARQGGFRFAGFSLPGIETVVGVGAGFVAAPVVSGMVSAYVPDTIKNNAIGQWGIKLVGALGPGLLIRKFVSAKHGNNVLIGGGAALVLDAIRTFAPGVIPGLGYQPMLGQYQRRSARGLRGYYDNPQTGLPFPSTNRAPAVPAMLIGTPERLSPQNRF